MSLKTFVCPRCAALRSIESWQDTGPEMLAIRLAPCGHVIERSARLEWRIGRSTRDRSGYALSVSR